MKMNKTLQERIERKQAHIGIMAMGYVGLPLARAFWESGFRVTGFDIDSEKVRMLNQGENYLKHFGEDFVREMVGDRFEASNNFDKLQEADVIVVCVPTPLGHHLDPDLSYIKQTSRDITERLREGQLIVLESTTYPGTTRDVMLPILESTGKRCGQDFYLAYSPEREDPGRKDHNTRTIPKLVGGLDQASGELAFTLYQQVVEQAIHVSSAEVAEAAKILENVYRAVNIALVNEMKLILTPMNISVWEVIEAAATKPFGYQAFYPGPGLGGHCIPIDPFYLTWKAREVGRATRFIELAGEINHEMPAYVVQRTMLGLNQFERAMSGSKILVLGLAYKPDVDDIRESPSFEIIRDLKELGAQVDYHDPHVPQTHAMRKHDMQMKSIAWSLETLRTYDAVVICTHHAWYNWQEIGEHAKLVIDTRGVMRHLETQATVISA